MLHAARWRARNEIQSHSILRRVAPRFVPTATWPGEPSGPFELEFALPAAPPRISPLAIGVPQRSALVAIEPALRLRPSLLAVMPFRKRANALPSPFAWPARHVHVHSHARRAFGFGRKSCLWQAAEDSHPPVALRISLWQWPAWSSGHHVFPRDMIYLFADELTDLVDGALPACLSARLVRGFSFQARRTSAVLADRFFLTRQRHANQHQPGRPEVGGFLRMSLCQRAPTPAAPVILRRRMHSCVHDYAMEHRWGTRIAVHIPVRLTATPIPWRALAGSRISV